MKHIQNKLVNTKVLPANTCIIHKKKEGGNIC